MNYKNIYSLIFIYYFFVCFFTNNNDNNILQRNVFCTHQITKTKIQDKQHIYKLIQNSLLSSSHLHPPPPPSTTPITKRYLRHNKVTEPLPESIITTITSTNTTAIITTNTAAKRILQNGDNYNEDGNYDDDESVAAADVRTVLSSSPSSLFNEDDELGKLSIPNYYEQDNDNYDDDNDDDSSNVDVEDNEKDLILALMQGTTCRTEWGIELPFETYVLDTCARCYHYMPDTAFKFGNKFSYLKYGHLFHPELNTTLASNETLILSHTFNSISMVFKWQQCCTDAILCCINHFHKFGNNKINNNTNQNDEKNFNLNQCPPTWDGWLCWDEYAQPNQLMERPCPKHIYWHQRVPPCRGYVTKLCNSTGHWYSNSDQREWSNYTMCARDDIYARRIRYSLITNIISMLALIPALIIFIHYKQVSSISRIRLHKHLFTSLLFHSIISALLKWHLLQGSSISDDVHNNPEDANLFALNHQKSSLLPSHFTSSSSSSLSLLTKSSTSSSGLLFFSSSNETISTNTDTSTSTLSTIDRLPPFCLILSIMQRYFRSTTYLWMFNEALYLHQLIRHAFTQPSLRPLIILAYTLPFITTTSYIIARSYFLQLITLNSNTKSNTNNNNVIPPPMMFSSPSLFGINDTTAQWSGTPSSFFSVFEHPSDDDYVDDLTSINYSSPLPIHLVSIKKIRRKLLSFKPDKRKYVQDKFNNSEKRTIRWSDYYYLNQNYDYNNEPNNNVPNNDNVEEVNTESFVEENNFAYVDEDHCWLMPSIQPWHEWIINGPNLAILIINCFFLVWLLRVLCIKAAASALASPPPLSLHSNASNCGSIHRQQQQSGSIKSRHYRQSDASSQSDQSKNNLDNNKHHSFRRTISNGSGSVAASNNNNNNNNETTGSTSTTSFTRQPSTSTEMANHQNVNQLSSTSTASTSSRLIRHYHRPSSILFNRQSFLVSLRAAVLLLPLYGLHYLFIVSRPKIETCWLSETYHYLSSSFDGLQGLMVAIIFCFANSEIRILLKRSIQRVSNRQRSLTIYMTEVGQPTTTVNQD